MKRPIWMLFLILPVLISHSQVDLHQLKQGQVGFGLSGQTGLVRLAETIRVTPVLSYGVFDAVEFHLTGGTNLVSDDEELLSGSRLEGHSAKIEYPFIIGSGLSTVYPIESLEVDLISRAYGDLQLSRATETGQVLVDKLVVKVNLQIGVSKQIRFSESLKVVPYACWNLILIGKRIEILGERKESGGESSSSHFGCDFQTPNVSFTVDLDLSPARRLTLMASYYPTARALKNVF